MCAAMGQLTPISWICFFTFALISVPYFRNAPLVAGHNRVILCDGGSADHQIALADCRSLLGQICPKQGMHSCHHKIKGNYGKLGQQALDKGLTAMTLSSCPRTVNAMEELRVGNR